MSHTTDLSPDTGSELNWLLENPIERMQHEQVLFENVPDQYVKDDDVTVFFTILQDDKINADEDQIGLTRVGCTKIKDCLAYASVQLTPVTTSGSPRHGTATFPSSILPATDDEFYQFCYITNKTKSLGSSIPFQLNCSLDDIDLLSNTTAGQTKSDRFISVADHDNEDIVVIHTKRILTEEKLRQENRQLAEMNRQLEAQKDECQAKLDILEAKTNEHIAKTYNEMQALTSSHQATLEELRSRQQSESKLRAEFDACTTLCQQYQNDALQHAQRCQTLEEAHGQLLHENNHIRSQLAVTVQLTKDQATQIIDLERRLMQSSELSKSSNQRHTLLEQQLRDLRLTTEKHQLSMQAQLNAYLQQTTGQTHEIQMLESANLALKEELMACREKNDRLLAASQQDKELEREVRQQLEQIHEQYRVENESAHAEIDSLQAQLKDIHGSEQAYAALKTTIAQIEKRCVKHQKSEIDVKRQLNTYKDFVNDLQREIQELTDRLSAGADAYKTLFRQHASLQRMTGQQEAAKADAVEDEAESPSAPKPMSSAPLDEAAVGHCPVCHMEFLPASTIEEKNDHIENHFQ